MAGQLPCASEARPWPMQCPALADAKPGVAHAAPFARQVPRAAATAAKGWRPQVGVRGLERAEDPPQLSAGQGASHACMPLSVRCVRLALPAWTTSDRCTYVARCVCTQVLTYVHKEAIMGVPVFKNCSAPFVAALVLTLATEHYMQQVVIVRQGEVWNPLQTLLHLAPGLGSPPAVSAPGLGSPPATSAPGLGSPAATSALGLGSTPISAASHADCG
jgi:hypothetical protein